MRVVVLILGLAVASAVSLLFGLVVVWLYRLLRGERRPYHRSAAQGGAQQTVMGTRRLAWRWPVGGLAVGAVGAGWATQMDALGRGWLVAVSVLGIGLVGGLVMAEVVVSGPQGRRRSAMLLPRRASDYIPRPLGGAVLGAVACLVAVLGMTTVLGSADDMGRSGRSLRHTCGQMSAAIGPWPGSFYTAPIAVTLVLMLVLAGLGLRVIAARPRPSGSVDIADENSRRRAGRAMSAAVGIAITTPLILVSVAAGSNLLAIACAAPWWDDAGRALLGLAFAASGVLGWCAVTLLTFRRAAPSYLPHVLTGS